MRTKLHLISMPWGNPEKPSIQLGCLRAHVEHTMGDAVEVATHSGHWQVPLYAAQSGYLRFFRNYIGVGEELYFLLGLGAGALPRSADDPSLESMLERLNAGSWSVRPVSKSTLSTLRRATYTFLREDVLSQVDDEAINIFGFTLHHEQVFAAILAAYFIRRHVPNAVFLFGGGSATFSETLHALDRADVPGFVVVGEGERPLAAMLEQALAAPDDGPDALLDAIEAAVPGALRIGGGRERPVGPGLRPPRLGRLDLDQLPVPDYEEYFEKVRDASPDEDCFLEVLKDTEILIEGSRGCFVQCDFCGLNSVWSRFQKMTPARVFDNVRTLVERYHPPRIRFVDNVCDTWAEAYADLMLAHGMKIETFMELRSHHSQEFFTKLSLVGVSEVQIGVEALSQPLLTAMRKRTKVIQNVRAQKYLVELGIRSMSNIMTHHPRSTVADVEETKRVIGGIANFGFFQLCTYSLAPDSPLYHEFGEDERAQVTRAGEWIHPGWPAFGQKFDYRTPPSGTVGPEVAQAWTEFRRWYGELRDRVNVCPKSLVVRRLGRDRLLVSDTRWFDNREYRLDGDRARVLEACHRGPTARTLRTELGLTQRELDGILGELLAQYLLVEVGGAYMSTPLRPRDELVVALLHPARGGDAMHRGVARGGATRAAPTSQADERPRLAVV